MTRGELGELGELVPGEAHIPRGGGGEVTPQRHLPTQLVTSCGADVLFTLSRSLSTIVTTSHSGA